MTSYACVTGADRGVGLALVQELLNRDWTVIAGQYADECGALERLEASSEGRLHRIRLDISDPASVERAADRIRSLTGALDLLINNAAVLGDIRSKVTEQLDFEEMEQVFRVNALGPLRMVQALVPLVMNSGMKLIVNISSEAGSIGSCWRDSWYAYCMSKAALNMQSALIHNELKHAGGQVMALHPGHVRTYMQGRLDTEGRLEPAESAHKLLKLIQDHKNYMGETPVYLDEEGRSLPW
ncbi:SDR family oxidoreductase [Gorillibacterium sp. sgz5001074]|uniref:SDR family oxidoreductase n=1 Tax=Gorillibacterium sp. sgz5001074 TaxID=3446695 RepID=UPI003F67BE3D